MLFDFILSSTSSFFKLFPCSFSLYGPVYTNIFGVIYLLGREKLNLYNVKKEELATPFSSVPIIKVAVKGCSRKDNLVKQ